VDDARFFAGLRPELAELARQHRAGCVAAQLHTAWGQDGGWRSPAAQQRLYEQGRKLTPTGWVVVDARKVVTNATAATGPHCRGAAYDLWLLFGRNGEQHLRLATMDPKDGWTPQEIEQQTTLWAAVVRIGTRPGLVAGAHFPRLKDFPHVELARWRDLPMKWS